MANSNPVSAGDQATAQQYNDLRDDVLDPTTGHAHTGAAEGGKQIATSDLTGHDKAAHDALGIDADTVDGFHGHDGTKAAHDALNIDADTVDGKHWSSMKYGGASMVVGNKDTVLASGEQVEIEVPYACTLRELKAREVEGLSGSATLTLSYYSSITDTTADWTEDISLSSQSYRSRTGLSRTLAKGGWLRLAVSGTPSTVKRVAVSVVVERT